MTRGARELSFPELVRLVGRRALERGAETLDDERVEWLARHGDRIYAEARGAAPEPYAVRADLGGSGPVQTRCTCPARVPFCRHVAALLLAWSSHPEAFVTTEAAPFAEEDRSTRRRSGRPRRGTGEEAEMLRSGLDPLRRTLAELAAAGVAASSSPARLEDLEELASFLRDVRLRRLAGRVRVLARLLGEARETGETVPSGWGRELTRAVRATEVLDDALEDGVDLDRRLEDLLVGRTWREGSLEVVRGLELVEVSWTSRETAGGFRIDASWLVDLGSGEVLTEKLIIPGHLAARTPPKPSREGVVVEPVRSGRYPDDPPTRVKLRLKDDPSPRTRPLEPADVERIRRTADPSLEEVVEAYRAHRRRPFAPVRHPVVLRCGGLVSREGRLGVLDRADPPRWLPVGLPPGGRAVLEAARRDAPLTALVGSVGLEPTGGLTLRARALVHGRDEAASLRRFGPHAPRSPRESDAAIPPAARELAAIRKQLDRLAAVGLSAGEGTRELADRLGAIHLEGPARVARALGDPGADADRRLVLWSRLHEALERAAVDLAEAPVVEEALVTVPGVEGVRVEAGAVETDRAASPAAAEDPFVGAVRAVAEAGPEEVEGLWPLLWADDRLVEECARRAVELGVDIARDLAREALATGEPATARAGLAILARPEVEDGRRLLRAVADGETVPGLEAPPDLAASVRTRARLLLRRAGEAPEIEADPGEGRIASLRPELASRRVGDRKEAARELGRTAAPEAVPLLCARAAVDPSDTVRTAALRGLAELAHPDGVPVLTRLVGEAAPEQAAVAARALSRIGDVRGVGPVLRSDRLKARTRARALKRIGRVAGPAAAAAIRTGELPEEEPTERAVARLRSPEVADALADHVAAPDAARPEALRATRITAHGLRALQERVVAALRPWLDDPVRRADALDAVATLDRPELLIRRAWDDLPDEDREAVKEAIAEDGRG